MMLYLILTLELFWFTACGRATCSHATICFASRNGSNAECQQYNVSDTFYRLSDLPVDVSRCKTLHLHLTGGIHILSKNLDISDSVEDTRIHGTSSSQPSIIKCQDNAGIRFGENNNISIENVMLLHCHRMSYHSTAIKAALYLKNASYILKNVVIMNTGGYGLYADHGQSHFQLYILQ